MNRFTINIARLSLPVLGVFVLSGLASPTQADTKPKGSVPTDPQAIFRLFSDTTTFDRSGGESEYFSADGTYNGITARKVPGVGKWYVTTKSRMCNETRWYYFDSASGEQSNIKDISHCFEFVTAPDGGVWMRSVTRKSDWFPYETRPVKRGNVNRRKFDKLRKKAGI